jgi:hypothetical protein
MKKKPAPDESAASVRTLSRIAAWSSSPWRFTARSERPRRKAQSVRAETTASPAAITHTAARVRRTESNGDGSATLSKS